MQQPPKMITSGFGPANALKISQYALLSGKLVVWNGTVASIQGNILNMQFATHVAEDEYYEVDVYFDASTFQTYEGKLQINAEASVRLIIVHNQFDLAFNLVAANNPEQESITLNIF
ncbi:MAG: hypothetical protein EZS28_032596 [Streblomastix strix]|uniref:Uncharacterized protein n=1 Tax=Streblomastix strix TaxID=222440 RepID=A0A5J4UN67_9EUKA|nr:MAG: hypothetical protein EZS28_032596 [Streblomastix strix]